MSQSDFQIDNVSRSLFRTENNAALQALASLSSGATEPATMYAYQWWADTSAGILKMRNAANNAWINKGSLSLADSGYIPAAGGTFTGDVTMTGASIYETEGAAVTSAATTDIWAGGDGNTVHVTGSTGPITSLGTAPQAGAWMKVIFDSTPTLTQSANLNLNAGGSNITIEAGDIAFVYADTTTQLDVIVHRKSGSPITGATVPASTTVSGIVELSTTAEFQSGTSTSLVPPVSAIRAGLNVLAIESSLPAATLVDITGIPSWVTEIEIHLADASTNSTSQMSLILGDAGGFETTTYVSNASTAGGTNINATTAFALVGVQIAADGYSGVIQLKRSNAGSNRWSLSAIICEIGTDRVHSAAGYKTLSDTLTQLRLTTLGGANSYDGGGYTVRYK